MGIVSIDIRRIWDSNWMRRAAFVAMGVAFLLPRHIDYVQSGLDPSWVYAINMAHERGWKFGGDVLFTHGPLGFLSSTCSVGRNIEFTLLVTGVLFLSQLWLLGRLEVAGSARRVPTGRIVAAGLLLWTVPRPPFESYLLYVVLLALSVAWFGERKRGCFAWACVLTTLQMFVKFTGALACGSAVGLFWAIWFFKDRVAWRTIKWIPLGIPVVFMAGHLLHYPSLAGLSRYLQAACALAAGHSIAMSWGETPLYTWLVLSIGGVYAVSLICMALRDRPQAQYLLLFGGAMAMTLKHALVRADLWHLDAALCAALPMFSLMLLFGRGEPRLMPMRRKAVTAVGLVLLGILLAGHGHMSDIQSFFRAAYMPHWNRAASLLGIAGKLAHPRQGVDPLPASILREVGTNAVAFYPLELSLAPFNDIELSPMPVLQAYAAYTPELDGFNAAFFRDDARAPAFIVLTLRTIDGRWPLIESPLAWTAIYEHYDLAVLSAPFLLLKRREQARVFHYREWAVGEIPADQEIVLMESAGPVFIRVELKLSFWGRLAKLLYHIPPVTMRAAFANGMVVEGRCIPDNLGSKTLVSFLPVTFDLQQTADFLQARHGANGVKRIAFGGPGLAYYEKTMTATLFEGQIMDVDGRKPVGLWQGPEP